jgi:hypothetical protein
MQKVIVNTKQQYKLLLLLIIFTFSVNALQSQKLDTPLDPVQVIIKDWEIGAFVGIGANFSSGVYNPECPDCLFEGNSKFGWSIGLKTDYEITKNFYLGTNLIFEDYGTNGSFRRWEDIELQRADNTTMEVPIEFRHILNLEMMSIGLAPNALWRVDNWLDLRFGVFADYIIGSNITHTKELLTKTALLPDGEKVKVYIEGYKDNKVVIEDRAIPDLNPLQFGLFPQINFNLPLSESSDLIFGTYMKIPLSKISSIQDNYSHYSWRVFMGVSFDLNKDGIKEIPIPRDRN